MNLDKPFTVDLAQQIASWSADGAATPLSNSAYSVVVTRHPELFPQLRRLGVLPVLPALSKQNLGRCTQTPLGALPRSLIGVLGVFNGVFEYLMTRVTPYCSGCCCEALPPVDIDKFAVPAGGFVAVAVVDDDSGASLQERCEWLGSERAIVRDLLVRTEDLILDDGGEPVIGVAPVASALSLHGEVSRWFSRGGSDLRLMHFASRKSAGLELGKLSAYWSCPSCKARFLQPSRAALESAAPCTTCNARSSYSVLKNAQSKSVWRSDPGWLLDDAKHLIACRDCDGFGVVTEMANYRVLGVPLRHALVLTATEFCARAGVLPEPLRAQFATIIACGFGDYPLGTPVDLLSQGELALLSVLSGELSRFSGVHYLLDAAIVASRCNAASGQQRAASILYAWPPDPPQPEPSQTPNIGSSPKVDTQARSLDILLRSVQIGSLNIPELRFPRGALTVVRGPTGSGKSLLLSVVASRFAKRNKLAHCASFGSLKRCSLVRAAVDTNQTVLEALGLAQELAHEIARTRRAQELGILEEELLLPRSRYRCGSCLGDTGGETGGEISGEQGKLKICRECQGALYDWRVADLSLAGRTVRELLSKPITAIQSAIWSSDWLESVVREFPSELRDLVTLGTPLASLWQPEARFLTVWGGLMKVLAGVGTVRGSCSSAALATDLVLVDGPCVMPITQMQEIGELLTKIKELGATMVYADMPQGLESHSNCVLELLPCQIQHSERASRPNLDTRYARTFDLGAL